MNPPYNDRRGSAFATPKNYSGIFRNELTVFIFHRSIITGVFTLVKGH